MKTLSIVIAGENLKFSEEDKGKTIQEVVSAFLKTILANFVMMDKKEPEVNRRKFYKISDVLDEAVKEGKEEIILEDDWFGLIKQAKRETQGLNPNSLLVRRIEENIDAVKDR